MFALVMGVSLYWINSPKIRAVRTEKLMSIAVRTAPRGSSWDKKVAILVRHWFPCVLGYWSSGHLTHWSKYERDTVWFIIVHQSFPEYIYKTNISWAEPYKNSVVNVPSYIHWDTEKINKNCLSWEKKISSIIHLNP